jgi:hypothetical protein
MTLAIWTDEKPGDLVSRFAEGRFTASAKNLSAQPIEDSIA